MANTQLLRRLLGSVRGLRFSDEAQIDLSDRLDLISVPSGLRSAAAFGFRERKDEKNWAALKSAIETCGLTTIASGPIRRSRPSELAPELSAVFDEIYAQSDANQNDTLLWVVSAQAGSAEVDKAVSGSAESGIVLGYPACCVKHERTRQDAAEISFQNAIVKAVGENPEAIRRALREDLKVELPADTFYDRNAPLTHRAFPFVAHIACDQCLQVAGSATAVMNEAFGSLARKVDRVLYQAILDMSQVAAEVETIITDAEAKGLGPGKLDPATNQRLQGLFRLRLQIHARAIAP